MAIVTKQHKSPLSRPIKKGMDSIIKEFPYKRMEGAYVVDRNEHYQAFLRVSTQNVFGLSEDDQAGLMDSLTTLLRVYVECVNIISLKFPPSLEKNIVFWQKYMIEAREANDYPRILSCQENLTKLFWAEKNLPELEFFITVFGKTKDELKTNIRLLSRFSQEILITDLKPEEVKLIIYKLCNMNTEI